MTYVPAASATKTALTTSASRGSAPINAIRANKLVSALNRALTDQNAANSGTSKPRLYGYGLAKFQTTRVFRQIVNGKLHLVDAIAADEIDGVFAYLIDGVVVFPGNFPGQLRPDGTIFSGRFSGTGLKGNLPPIGSKIIERKGAAGQTVVDDLINETQADSSFVGTGHRLRLQQVGIHQRQVRRRS